MIYREYILRMKTEVKQICEKYDIPCTIKI